jgi:hypothetical protein
VKVTISEPLEISLRNTGADERRRVWGWIDALKMWGTDPYITEQSKKLGGGDNTYMLITPSDLRLFFSVEKDEITVLDAARRSTILASRQISEAADG